MFIACKYQTSTNNLRPVIVKDVISLLLEESREFRLSGKAVLDLFLALLSVLLQQQISLVS